MRKTDFPRGSVRSQVLHLRGHICPRPQTSGAGSNLRPAPRRVEDSGSEEPGLSGAEGVAWLGLM